jgi:hypothetical protein
VTDTGAAAAPGGLARVERSEEAMGSWFAVVLHGPERAELEAAAEAAFVEVHRLDRLLSNYRPASEWSRVNRDAASGPVRVSDELFDLLSACLEYSRQSGGAFDITVGRLVTVWGFYKGEGALPKHPVVTQALGRVGINTVLNAETAASSSARHRARPGGRGITPSIGWWRCEGSRRSHGARVGGREQHQRARRSPRRTERVADLGQRSRRREQSDRGDPPQGSLAVDVWQL